MKFVLVFACLSLLLSVTQAQITLKKPANGATGVSVLPTFEWESKSGSAVMFQVKAGMMPVYIVGSIEGKSVSYKLMDAKYQGGGMASMKGKLDPNTTYTWELMDSSTGASVSASFTTGADDAGETENPMEAMMFDSMAKTMKAPARYPLGDAKVGQWVELQSTPGDAKIRNAIVGKEANGQLWFEMKMITPQMKYVTKYLIDPKDGKVLKAFIGCPGKEGKPIEIMAEVEPVKGQEAPAMPEIKEMGSEKVKTPAGEFNCNVQKITAKNPQGESVTTTYISTEVPFGGLVKSVSDIKASGMEMKVETILIGMGKDAVSDLK